MIDKGLKATEPCEKAWDSEKGVEELFLFL
jgi:hypothetical protein